MRQNLIFASRHIDEVLGCGMTMAKHKRHGEAVACVVATNPTLGESEGGEVEGLTQLVRDQQKEAMQQLEVDTWENMGAPRDRLNANLDWLRKLIAEAVDRYEPQRIYAPSKLSARADDAALTHSIEEVLRNYVTLGTAIELLYFPTPDMLGPSGGLMPINVICRTDSSLLRQKLLALEKYQPHPDQWPSPWAKSVVTHVATSVGAVAMQDYAEGFSSGVLFF